jgi:polysaccharide pyruvyl transferase WcaK-like protein
VEVDLQNFGYEDSDVSFGTRAIARDFMRSRGPIKEKLSRYDYVLDSGAGDSFTDIYGIKRLFLMFYARRAAFKLGIPVIMGPQTIGPFNTAIGSWVGRRSLSMMDSVIARDPDSADCSHLLGRLVDAVSTDVVFTLADPTPSTPRDVVLNISGLLWRADDHVNSAHYREQTQELVSGLVSVGRKVSLLAHAIGEGRDDDVYAIEQFQSDFGSAFEIVVPATLSEARSILASANVVVGARMHACLNALSVGTPAIAWAYSRKFAPLMHDLGWPYVLDLADSSTNPAVDTFALISSVSQAELDEAVVSVQSRARERLELAVAALRRLDGAI